ncbi:MAG: DinB family protein [Segetibacter sp.]|nr:DinB family protein [Segetibacter sp.]
MRKTYITTLLLIISATFIPASRSICQTTISADSIKSMLVKDWERAKDYTQDYMKAMPADKYSFKATDSVRSFAQQLLHLAQANMFLVSTGTGDKPTYAGPDLEKSASAQSADSVMYYVNSSYDFAINSIKKLAPSSLLQTASMNMGRPLSATRLSWLLKAFEHQTHHRGQTTIYLRLAGVHPPNERLF